MAKTGNTEYKIWYEKSWITDKEPLYSYVTAVTYLPNIISFRSILYVSTIFGKYPLAKPKILDNQLVCSPGTEAIP